VTVVDPELVYTEDDLAYYIAQASDVTTVEKTKTFWWTFLGTVAFIIALAG
jgi:hypothetical protein